MKFIQDIRDLFNDPTAEALALRQYESTKRELLNADAYLEHYKHRVACLTERRDRLAKVVEANRNGGAA